MSSHPYSIIHLNLIDPVSIQPLVNLILDSIPVWEDIPLVNLTGTNMPLDNNLFLHNLGNLLLPLCLDSLKLQDIPFQGSLLRLLLQDSQGHILVMDSLLHMDFIIIILLRQLLDSLGAVKSNDL